MIHNIPVPGQKAIDGHVTSVFLADKVQNEINSANFNFVEYICRCFHWLIFELVFVLTKIFIPQFGAKMPLTESDNLRNRRNTSHFNPTCN